MSPKSLRLGKVISILLGLKKLVSCLFAFSAPVLPAPFSSLSKAIVIFCAIIFISNLTDTLSGYILDSVLCVNDENLNTYKPLYFLEALNQINASRR